MEFIFVDSEEFREFREDVKQSIKFYKRHPFKIILSLFTLYLIIVSTIILFD